MTTTKKSSKKPTLNFHNRLLASTLVLPSCGSRPNGLDPYCSMITTLSQLKLQTDLIACWMRRNGYSKLSIELYGSHADFPSRYQLNLK